jgi:hypothetical protein
VRKQASAKVKEEERNQLLLKAIKERGIRLERNGMKLLIVCKRKTWISEITKIN